MYTYHHEHVLYPPDRDIIARINHNDTVFVTSHWHNSLEIVYILDGSEHVCVNLKNRVIGKNEFVIVGPREIHAYESKVPSDTLLLLVSYKFLKRYIPDIDMLKISCNPSTMPNNPESFHQIQQCLDRIAALLPLSSEDCLLEIYAQLFSMLFHLRHDFSTVLSPEDKKSSGKYMQRLGQITAFVREHYAEEISLKRISDEVSLNPDYFTRFFKKYMGMTFLDYLNYVRLEHIYMDLFETDLSIKELLEIHGFTNYKLFMRLFKQKYGMTPNEARKKI